MISEQKQRVRKEMRRTLRGMTADQRHSESRQICETLAALPEWNAAQTIAVFYPLASEPDLSDLLFRCRRGSLAFPDAETGHFRRVHEYPVRLTAELFIPDPNDEVVEASSHDIVLVPGLAFDCSGRRLGRGGGFYDRILAHSALRARTIGICFACQVIEEVPTDETDIAVGSVLTGEGWKLPL